MGLIYYLSSLPHPLPDLEERWAEELLSKAGHFGEYAGLAFWLVFGWTGGKPFRVVLPRWKLLLSAGISLLYSASDEIHQLFVPGREFQFSDLAVDALGMGLTLLYFMVKNGKND
jgi:VanZ family protein